MNNIPSSLRTLPERARKRNLSHDTLIRKKKSADPHNTKAFQDYKNSLVAKYSRASQDYIDNKNSETNTRRIKPGYLVEVSYKEMDCAFGKGKVITTSGIVLRIHRNSISSTIRILISHKDGTKTHMNFPFYHTSIIHVKILKMNKMRQARPYYMSDRSGKSARLKEIRTNKKK